MDIVEFSIERIQSLYENTVDYNLSDSGVHPYTLRELLDAEQINQLLDVELGYGWTNGGVELRQSISKLYKDKNADNVIVTNGSAEANFVLVMGMLNPGDELVVIVPNYLQIWGWAKALNVKVVEVPLREELGWLPDLDELKDAITPNTKMISYCSPNNPTGSVLPQETLEQIVDLARAQGIYVHADEVYKGSELDGNEGPSIADLYEKGIATNGLSKAMALPGLRVGWLAGPKDVIDRAWHCKDYTSITTSSVSEFAANIVVQPQKRSEILERSRTILNQNVATLDEWIKQNSENYSCQLPQAGGMAFVRYSMNINSTDLVHRMRTERSIMLLPGDCYGMDGYIRIGVGAPSDHLKAGLAQLHEFTRGLND
ncbi:aminotransferase class I/II-fold pyridoxal phosphate-dependent enzyme [uncultured Maritalea sp.]|uniref:aminotransferase class I/II-fold pyridoxal phosphate-dependent enzyme n=1 Tax=uncultured Maritalea sp. TaxID=757249 RepID=UPI00260341C5|nr:aminotransferase class I/II-fold pyridoxal phosphate-dependent enzyme [uncultured Maritalea sp.]